MAKQKTSRTNDIGHGTHDGTVDLSQKAVLVLLGTGQWTARKIDRNATRRVIEAAGADPEAGRFNKSLLPGNDLVKRIAKNISTFRQDYHYTVTLPWGDDGWRLLPAKRISEYRATFRKHQDIHNELVDKFVADYPEYREAAKQTLGTGPEGLWNETDYPSQLEIRDKYRFATDWSNIDSAEDLRVKVSEDVAKEIKREIEENTQRKLNVAVADTHNRVHAAVSAVIERLTDDPSGDPKIFRDSLIGNLKDLADLLPSLNVTDDPALGKVADAIHVKLAQLDPQALRDDADARAKTVKSAKEILEDLNGVF